MWLRPPLPSARTARPLRWSSKRHVSCIHPLHRHFHVSSAVLSSKRRNASDDSEAALAQQLLDYMKLADDTAVSPCSASSIATTIPIDGVVISVQNGLACVTGLRHATIGSIVDVVDASSHVVSQGLVLFMEKKVVHLALLHASATPVLKGMNATLQQKQLEIDGSVAAFAGAVVDPLGRPIRLNLDQGQEDTTSTAHDRIQVTWSAQSVPGVMTRAPLHAPFETGLVAVDCLNPMAFGHRFGVFGPKNVGKTRVVVNVIAHQVERALQNGEEPPQFVYVCVGKSMARIYQIQEALKMTQCLEYTTIVAATDRESSVLQYLAPFTGCAVAEFLMHKGKSRKSVVVYDDVATHTMVVEGLVHSLKLPRAAHTSLCAHAVLMERSAQFKSATGKKDGPSLTSFVLVDTLDSGESASELQERITSLIDDCIWLDSSLARCRVFPPINVLAPGASVRGPPFQSATRWAFISRLRARINAAAHVKDNVDLARTLGFETEPHDAEMLEFLDLVQAFFTQRPLVSTAWTHAVPSELETELGAYFLTIVDVAQLPRRNDNEERPLDLWDFIRAVVATLSREENADMLQQLHNHSRTKAWSLNLQENVGLVLADELEAMKRRRLREYKEERGRR